MMQNRRTVHRKQVVIPQRFLFGTPAVAAAVLLALGALVAPACGGGARPTAAGASGGTATLVVPVEGMTCGGCEVAVEIAVRKVPGVVSVDADYEKAQARVVYDPAVARPDAILEAINGTGYKAGAPETAPPQHAAESAGRGA